MNPKIHIRRTLWGILVAFLIIEVLFDPYSEIKRWSEYQQAKIGLPGAREKWEAQSIAHYKFDVTAATPHLCIWGANIEVKNNIVVHTGKITDPDYWDFPMGVPQNSGQFPVEMFFICDYRNYTVPRLFNYLERQLKASQYSVTSISFDPEYGFISQFGFGSPGGRGLFSPRIYDCCGGLKIFNFVVLDE